MFDVSDAGPHRNCSICRLHYIARADTDGGLTYEPVCDCEAKVAARAEQQALVDRARTALHESLRAIGPMLRRPTAPRPCDG